MNEELIYELTNIRETLERQELTKREQIAAMCLQGLIANSLPNWIDNRNPKNMARLAVKQADALIAEIEKINKKK